MIDVSNDRNSAANQTNSFMDLGSWLARRAASSGNQAALSQGGTTLTYRALLDRVDRLSGQLALGGVSRGDRVGYLGINDMSFLIALFATARAGAIFVPLNFRLAAPELLHILGDAGIHTLIADADHTEIVDSVRNSVTLQRTIAVNFAPPGWESLHDLEASTYHSFEPVLSSASDVAIIMYTSGTTGYPKGAMITHGNLFWNNVNAGLVLDVSHQDVTLVVTPLFHVGGLNVTTLPTLHKGGHVVLMTAFEASEALQTIESFGVTTMFGVPTIYSMMALDPGFENANLDSINYFICGGAPVPESLIRQYGQRGIAFAQGYGLTETTAFALMMRTDEALDKIGAAGHQILPLSDVRLINQDGRSTQAGERGEIQIRGPQVMAGYWNNPEATAAAFDEAWFRSGDIGELDDEGYVYVVDRLKDIIVTGGENVYPAEVERVLHDHPAIRDAAVIGLPDPHWGETVTACLVLNSGFGLTHRELKEFCRANLAGYKVPRRVEFLEEVPRNAGGKLLKYQLIEFFS